MRMTEPCRNSNQHQSPFSLRVFMLAVVGFVLLCTMGLADKPEEKKLHPHRGVRKFAVEKDVHGFLFKAAKANGCEGAAIFDGRFRGRFRLFDSGIDGLMLGEVAGETPGISQFSS